MTLSTLPKPLPTHLPAISPEPNSLSRLFSYDIDLTSKIDSYINSFPFFSGNFFSNETFYKTIQVTLLTSSCIGVIGAIGLLALGMPSFSLMMFSLSTTTAIGAYLASEVITSTALESTVEILQEQTEKFQIENTVLNSTNTELKSSNAQFKASNEEFKASNAEYKARNEEFKARNEEFKANIKKQQEETNKFERENNNLINYIKDLGGKIAILEAMDKFSQEDKLVLREIREDQKSLLNDQKNILNELRKKSATT